MKVIVASEVKPGTEPSVCPATTDTMANDDSKIPKAIKPKEILKLFKRSASEASFASYQQVEKTYSKLGDSTPRRVKDPSKSPLREPIRVASMSALNVAEHDDANGETPFVGRRDVSNPGSVKEKRITSSRGSIRGYKNRVRAGIATFLDQNGFSVSTCIHIIM